MPDIRSVSTVPELFTQVAEIRREWTRNGRLKPHRELWFRGEPRDYGDTALCPKIFRPVDNKTPVDVPKIVKTDVALFNEF
jgi:hypothetical protein